MYKAVHTLRHSDAHRLTLGQQDKHVHTTPPTYLAPGQGSPLAFKINPNFYQSHYKKATPM
eukprot:5389118-Karenia_brevis.AAC.1